MSPVWLYKLGTVKVSIGDYKKIEKELHELFAPYRTWGEWFEFPIDHLRALKKCFRNKDCRFDYESFKTFWRRELRELYG